MPHSVYANSANMLVALFSYGLHACIVAIVTVAAGTLLCE